MINKNTEKLNVIEIKLKNATVNCIDKVKTNDIVSTAEKGANEYLKKYCTNPVLRNVYDFVDKVGVEGLHRILMTRIDKLFVDKNKEKVVICLLDFYEHERYWKKKYAYRSIECCIDEHRCRTREANEQSVDKYEKQIKIVKYIWHCWDYSNTNTLALYVKTYFIIPLRRNNKGDAILRNFYKKTGVLKELYPEGALKSESANPPNNDSPTLAIGPHTKLCKDPYGPI